MANLLIYILRVIQIKDTKKIKLKNLKKNIFDFKVIRIIEIFLTFSISYKYNQSF